MELKKVGETVEGKHVVSGVFRFIETHGVPLEELLLVLQEKSCVPDWIVFCREAKKAGMSHKRIMAKLESAISDSLGSEIRDRVLKNLGKLEKANLLYV